MSSIVIIYFSFLGGMFMTEFEKQLLELLKKRNRLNWSDWLFVFWLSLYVLVAIYSFLTGAN